MKQARREKPRANTWNRPRPDQHRLASVAPLPLVLKAKRTLATGVAATLAWQSYGETTKQMIATSAPELGWSPETKHMIASGVQQLGWTKSSDGPESSAAQPSVPETQLASVVQTVPVPKAPAATSIDPEQVHQIAVDLAALGRTVDQLAASQDQMVHQIDTLQTSNQEILTSNQEILEKIPAA